jgi:hypothetical protein
VLIEKYLGIETSEIKVSKLGLVAIKKKNPWQVKRKLAAMVFVSIMIVDLEISL